MELSGNVNNLSDAGAIAYLQEQERIRRARSKRRWITAGVILAGLLVLMVGCGIAVGAAASGGSSSSTRPAPTAATEVPADSGLHEETRIVPAPAAAVTAPITTAPVTAPSTELPRTWIDAGMWHAPDEIETGTYRTTGRAASETYKCMITVTGADGNVADYQSADTGPLRITVHDGQTVTVEGCAPLTKVG